MGLGVLTKGRAEGRLAVRRTMATDFDFHIEILLSQTKSHHVARGYRWLG